MQRELPDIRFTTQAEARSHAEHRRSEEIAGLLKPLFERWSARFHRRLNAFNAVKYPRMSAVVGDGRLTPGQS